MRTEQQIAADNAAEAAEAALRPARSFRGDVEEMLAGLHDRLTKCEAGVSVGSVDDEGSSLAGKIRTFEARILAVETVQAENTSNILRVTDLVQTQLAGATSRIAALEADVRALKPQQ